MAFLDDVRYDDLYGSESTFRHLIVLTNSADGWKMYCYDFGGGGTADTLAGDTPVKTYSGTGRATQALYRGLVSGPSF